MIKTIQHHDKDNTTSIIKVFISFTEKYGSLPGNTLQVSHNGFQQTYPYNKQIKKQK